jgi:hypothetical protein
MPRGHRAVPAAGVEGVAVLLGLALLLGSEDGLTDALGEGVADALALGEGVADALGLGVGVGVGVLTRVGAALPALRVGLGGAVVGRDVGPVGAGGAWRARWTLPVTVVPPEVPARDRPESSSALVTTTAASTNTATAPTSRRRTARGRPAARGRGRRVTARVEVPPATLPSACDIVSRVRCSEAV